MWLQIGCLDTDTPMRNINAIPYAKKPKFKNQGGKSSPVK